jgi:DNA-binding response OmpR family regulator
MQDYSQHHLVLCDWHMSPTDGMELLKFVRAHPTYGAAPFIMVTAESTKEQVVEAIKQGVDEYIVKPLTPDQIQGKVFGVLTRKQIIA